MGQLLDKNKICFSSLSTSPELQGNRAVQSKFKYMGQLTIPQFEPQCDPSLISLAKGQGTEWTLVVGKPGWHLSWGVAAFRKGRVVVQWIRAAQVKFQHMGQPRSHSAPLSSMLDFSPGGKMERARVGNPDVTPHLFHLLQSLMVHLSNMPRLILMKFSAKWKRRSHEHTSFETFRKKYSIIVKTPN